MKSKTQTPQRVRILLNGSITTVYVSCRVASEIRPFCMRLSQQIMHPLKGQNDVVHAVLVELARQRPDEFMSGSRIQLLGRC